MKTPEVGSQLQVGDESLYVYEIDTDGGYDTGWGSQPTVDDRVVMTCHDNYGNEVEIRFYPDPDED